MAATPLAVLDLVPIASGSNAAEALRNSLDLAQRAERFGYARYWFAEHHLNPGVAGSSPAVMLALTAAATSAIRIGSGAVQLGHRTSLSVVEEFGLIDALYPGRLDLGLGRSGGRARGIDGGCAPATATQTVATRAANGLLLPLTVSLAHLVKTPHYQMEKELLHLPGAKAQDYGEQVGDILALLRGSYRTADGTEAHVVPGEGADVQVWILGSSGGQSATVAGANGLRFAANYHLTPGTVVDAAQAYRAAFQPSVELGQPYVSVSADVVVAEDEVTARELATGYGLWIRSIRMGEGAIEFPTPRQARKHAWSDVDRALVADRLATQFVGSPQQVCGKLEQLRDATGADELIITTITHDHADRVYSYELLAAEWQRRGG